jgi:hypothetical protein
LSDEIVGRAPECNKITVRLKLGAEPPEWARHRISEMK